MIRKIPDNPRDRTPAQEASRHLCIEGYVLSTCWGRDSGQARLHWSEPQRAWPGPQGGSELKCVLGGGRLRKWSRRDLCNATGPGAGTGVCMPH